LKFVFDCIQFLETTHSQNDCENLDLPLSRLECKAQRGKLELNHRSFEELTTHKEYVPKRYCYTPDSCEVALKAIKAKSSICVDDIFATAQVFGLLRKFVVSNAAEFGLR